jgi:hypothetical protein
MCFTLIPKKYSRLGQEWQSPDNSPSSHTPEALRTDFEKTETSLPQNLAATLQGLSSKEISETPS